ncbi:MAG: hypothetical protein IPP67_01930 [Rhodospirillaceae bacterium]|nr:hypothetical protein [Rhodospirillaceae bacterium]
MFYIGKIELAEEVAKTVIKKTTAYDEQVNLAWAECLLAEILINKRDGIESENLLQKIYHVAKKYQLLPLMAEYYRLSAQLARAQNNKAKFNHYRQKANQLFEKMQMKDKI